MLPFITDPLEISQLVPKIQAVEGLAETKKLPVLFGYILKSVFACSDSFCLITSPL